MRNNRKLTVFILFLTLFLSVSIHAVKKADIKEVFDYGLNIFDYDFSFKEFKFDDVMKILKNNNKIDVQTEVIINWLFYSKDYEKAFSELEVGLGTAFLKNEPIQNLDYIFAFVKFIKVYNIEEKYLEDIVDVMREFTLLEKLYKGNPWIYIVYSDIMFLFSKEKLMEKYQLPFYEKVEYAIYSGSEDPKVHYAVANFFKLAGRKNPSAHRLSVIEYQKAINFAPENVVLKTSVLKNLVSILEIYNISGIDSPLWLQELIYKYTIDINPNDAFAYNNLAYLYIKDPGKVDKALEYAKKAYSMRPEEPQILDTLALCYMGRSEYDKARKYFEKAYSLEPGNTDVLRHMADFYLVVDQKELSIGYMKEYLKKEPTDIEIMNNLAYLLATEGKELNKAQELIEKVLQMDKENSAIYMDTLGWIYYKKKRYKDALKVFNDIKDAEDAEILTHKAYVFAKLSMYRESMIFFRKVIRVSPEDDVALNNWSVLRNLIENDDKIDFMKNFIWEG